MAEAIKEILNVVKGNNAVIGTDEVIKKLKTGKIAKVFLTSNCPDSVKSDITHYAKISGAEVVQLKQPNGELGILCKKPFSISVMGIKKGV